MQRPANGSVPAHRSNRTSGRPPGRRPVSDESLAELAHVVATDGAISRDSGNLEDATYDRMRQALIDGRFHPGQRFTIRALASVFGISAMPVRDALKRLVAERAFSLLPNRSVTVPLMSRARFQEIVQIRLSLETMITVRATNCISPTAIEAMTVDHHHMCSAVARGDATQYFASNRSFHFRLYRAAGTVEMFPMIESMWMQIGPYLNQVFQSREGGTDLVDHHHTRIIRALHRNDATAAAQAVWDDLSSAADQILTTNWFSP